MFKHRTITKVIAVVSVTLLLSGCFQNQNFYKPKPFGMGGPAKDAPPDYLEGWNDGCETGSGTMVPAFYKSFYKYKINPNKVSDLMYYKAWKDAYTYCRHFTFKFIWDAWDRNDNLVADTKLCVFCFP